MRGELDTIPGADRGGTLAVLGVAAIILTAANLPHLVGILSSTDDHVFSGTLSNNLDQLSYYTKMRAGFEGKWTYENLNTPEPTAPVPIFMFYIVLGHLARLGGLSILATSHAARILSGVFLLFMLDRLFRAMGWRGGFRALGMVVVCAGCGIGWIQGFGFSDQAIEFRPLEYWLIEGYVFQSMANYSHFAFGTALLLGIMTEGVMIGVSGWSAWRVGRLVLFAFLLGWVHPRLLAVPFCVFVVTGLLEAIRVREPRARWLLGALLIAGAGLPPGLLALYSIRGQEVWRATLEPVMLSPGLGQLLRGYGLLLPFAWVGVWRVLREPEPGWLWLVAWFAAGALLIWVPLDSQRRLIQGLDIPIGILAVAGASHVLHQWIPRAGENRLLAGGSAVIFATVVSIGSGFYTVHELRRVQRGAHPTFWTEEYSAGLAWLDRFGRSDEIVLCALKNGVLIPPFAGKRVVLGHWSETLDAPKKARIIAEFFDDATTAERRREIVRQFNVTLLVHSRFEKELGGYDPASTPDEWRQVWQGIEMRFFQKVGLPPDPKRPVRAGSGR